MGGFVVIDPVSQTGAKVSKNQRLETESVTLVEKDRAAISGWKFNINTGDITLTNATKTSVLYVKNTDEYDLSVDSLIYNLGNTTSGSGDVKVEVIRNPTAGDIITNANNVETGAGVEANKNFASTNTLTGLFYKGATGETALSGGDGATISTRSASNTGRIVISLGNLILPKGTAIGIDYTPPTSNTSQTVQFAISCHIRNPDFVDIT
jgi:hypothetical protein